MRRSAGVLNHGWSSVWPLATKGRESVVVGIERVVPKPVMDRLEAATSGASVP